MKIVWFAALFSISVDEFVSSFVVIQKPFKPVVLIESNRFNREFDDDDGGGRRGGTSSSDRNRFHREFDDDDGVGRRGGTSSSDRFNREIEEAARNRAQGGAGEMAAGAILGGLVLGPFGALFGAQIGASVGSANAVKNARKSEMERLGVTPEMLQMAEEAGAALERSIEGMKAIRDSLETQQRFAKRLDTDMNQVYERAKIELEASNEDKARELLMERQRLQDKLKKTLISCADEKKRLEQMEDNIKALEERAMEVERLLQRSVGAKAMQDTSSGLSNQFSLGDEDPLIQKFRDMGIK